MASGTRPRHSGAWLAIAALLAGVLPAACGGEEGASPPSQAELSDPSAEAATVNGQIIYVADVELEARLKGVIGAGERLDPASPEFDEILEQLIEIKLLAMEAIGRGLDEEPEARHRLETARDNILGNILLEHIAAERIDETAIRRMYEAQVKLLEEQMESEARVRHILAPTKEAIDRIAAELRGGAEFMVVAARRSTDQETRMDGGDLGYMTASEAPPAFARVIRELPEGGVSRPFEDEEGWHIVKVEDVRKRRPPSMEELRDRIERYLKQQQLGEVMKELRASADIVKRTQPRAVRPEPARQPARPPPEPAFRAQAPEGAAAETREPVAAEPASPAPSSPPAGSPAPDAAAPAPISPQ